MMISTVRPRPVSTAYPNNTGHGRERRALLASARRRGDRRDGCTHRARLGAPVGHQRRQEGGGVSDDAATSRQTPSAARLRKLLDRSLIDLKLAADAARAEGRNDVAALVEGSRSKVRERELQSLDHLRQHPKLLEGRSRQHAHGERVRLGSCPPEDSRHFGRAHMLSRVPTRKYGLND